MQNTLIKVGSKDFSTISHLASLIFVEFAEELTQSHSIPFIGDMAIGRFYYLVDSYCNSSTGLNRQAVHILPQRCLLDLHPNLQQKKVICPYFHV